MKILLFVLPLSFLYTSVSFGDEPLCPTTPYRFDDLEELARYMDVGVDSRLPQHKQQFCQGNPRNISLRLLPRSERDTRSTLNTWAMDNTLAFENPPGPVGGGMCWLHSRLQRQFTYLANYQPTRPRPTQEEAQRIINRIVNREGVTEIPGFSNLSEFSAVYRSQLISAIDGMGWRCFVNPTDCAARISDSYNPSAADMQATMQTLYDRQTQQPGSIRMVRTRVHSDQNLVFRGLMAHSMLILDMVPIHDNSSNIPGVPGPIRGYRMKIIDPNHPNLVEPTTYLFGDRTLRAGGLDVLPYTHYEYEGDIPLMNQQIAEYCRR
jgi:hypothetical protein